MAYVVDGEVAHERLLSLGMSTKDGWIEVRSGLKAGDLLVVRGGEALSEGAKVRPTRVSSDSIGKNLAKANDAGAKGPDPGAPASSGEPPTDVSPGATPTSTGADEGAAARPREGRRGRGGPAPSGANSAGAPP